MAPSAQAGADGADAAAQAADAKAQTLADALIAGGDLPPYLDDAARLALAWLLKARCYAAWSSAPETTAAIAQAARRLTTPRSPAAVEALADWTEGIAAIVRADMQAALDALDAAARTWHALDEPTHEAQTNVPRIAALSMLGRFDDAAACGESARAALESAGDPLGAARVSVNLGSLAVLRGRYAEALPHYRAAAALFARVGDREHSVMADLGLADALNLLGDFDEAVRILDRAGVRAQRHGLPVLEAGVRLHRAHLDLARGDFAAALAGFETSRRHFDHLGLPGSRLEAEKNLADAYLELNLLPEAEALYSSLETALRDTPTLPWIRLQRARAAAMAARYTDARALLEQASYSLAAQGNTVGEAHLALVEAQVQLAAGDTTALEVAARAADAFDRLGLARAHAAARVVHADALRAAGHHDAAIAACVAALVHAGPQTRVQAWAVRGEALLASNQLEPAKAAFDTAIDAFEALRQRVPGDELRRAFVSDVMRPYRRRLAIALDDATRDAACPEPRRRVAVEDAFGWLERFKARALAERSAGTRTEGSDDRSEGLRMRLDWIHRRQQEQLEADGTTSASLRDEGLRIEYELLETRRRGLALEGPLRPSGERPGDGPAENVADPAANPRDSLGAVVAEALGENEAIVEYGVVDDELFAFVVDRSDITLHRRLGSWREVVHAVQGLRFQIETLRRGHAALGTQRDALRERMRGRLARVHQLVWQPLETRVRACGALFIVPHGILHGLPFAALDGGEGALFDRHLIGLAPNAASLAQRPPPRRDGTVLLMGDTRRLVHARAELDAAAVAWPGAIVLADADADADRAVLERHASHACLMHLACHASFRPDNPRFSWLQIGDGRLLACDVERWRMPASTVVLSGCETAVADPDAGDEALGLVRAFLMAGAARVIGSLWPVEDASTAVLMSALHAALADGRTAAAALHEAQRVVRASHDDPYHWAGFMVHGGL